MKVRFVDFGKGYKRIKKEIDKTMQDVLSRGQLILRDEVEEFEEKLAKYVGTRYAVGVASGTDALILSLKAAGIGQGDEVITTSYTFRATVEAIHLVGATPVLADLGEDWKKYKTTKTKAIIPTHIAGETLDWKPEKGIVMIEDACQAIGAKPVEGLTACYSFYPAKILGCYGDGGAIATNSKTVYDELKIMRNHYKGNWKPYGYNSRLDNIQAAVLNVKIKYLPKDIKRRKEIAVMYDKGLSKLKLQLPNVREVYQDYIITLSSKKVRDALFYFLKENGIESLQDGYPFPEKSPKKAKAVIYESKSLRIPCNAEISDQQVKYVITTIKNFFTM